jgi:hypothetical protein
MISNLILLFRIDKHYNNNIGLICYFISFSKVEIILSTNYKEMSTQLLQKSFEFF